MKNPIMICAFATGLTSFSTGAIAVMEDDPLLFMLKADQLEARDADVGTIAAWEGFAWLGKDLDKLWFKTEGERLKGENESAEYQLLYSRAIDANWDIQLGFKHDSDPVPTRDWGVVSLYGVAPYWLEVDASLFFNDSGQINLRFETEYEVVFTQRWVLTPEVEINLFREDDRELNLGSGLADLEFGLRLRYEFTRQFAPYIGIHHEALLGDTANIAEANSIDTSDTQVVAGIRFWF